MHPEVGESPAPRLAAVAGPVGRNGSSAAASTTSVTAIVEGRTQPRAKRYASPWKVWLPIPILLLLLDATFNLYFWKIPKLTGPDADWGYQFLIDVHHAERPRPASTRRIVAFGSSVSVSFDPFQIGGLLSTSVPGDPLEVHRFMLPGVHPADYRLFWEGEADRIQPDVAVFMVNLLDFLSSSNEKDMNPTLRASLPPWKTLAERSAKLSTTEKLDWALRGVSNLYRFSKVVRSSVQDHIKFGLRRVLGKAETRPYGIYKDGFTKPRFGVAVTPGTSFELEYFVYPAWIQQRGQVTLSFTSAGRSLKTVVESEPGWKRLHLDIPQNAGRLLNVLADGFWNPRAAGEGTDVRLLAVQLREPLPANGGEGNKPPLAYPPFEPSAIHELLRMGGATGDEFARKWDQIMNADNQFGRRFRVYRDEKLAIRNRPFAASKEYAELERLVDELTRHKTKVVILNTSDSPWILEDYQHSSYYQGYLEFFAELVKRHPGVQFTDLRDALPPEDFNDWHHPNYIGAIKLAPRYVSAIQSALNAPPLH